MSDPIRTQQTTQPTPSRTAPGVASAANAAFARDVREGLTQRPKRLPCRWFYDREGSQLFEEICTLPEYYLTRAEGEILDAHAKAIVAHVPRGAALVELGAGSAAKTRRLIEAMLGRQAALRYVPIDIAQEALAATTDDLAREYPAVTVAPIAAEYEDGLARLRNEPDAPRMILWLGSSIGNLTRVEAAGFLRRVADTMARDDRLLCGFDLRKDRRTLEAAYDDGRGVTARFNLNLLARINRELGGRFDLETFRHRATYDEAAGRVAMFLVSARAQQVPIEALGIRIRFQAGETIHTEDSWKYSVDEIHALALAAGLRVEADWRDAAGRFTDILFGAGGSG